MIPDIDTLARARVLVVGDAMLDRYVHGSVERISPEAPVPVVRVTHDEDRIGAAANVAHNVVSLGARATLLSVIGDDEAGHRLEALVARTGIDAHFRRDAQLRTTLKLRVIGRQQQLLRLDYESPPQGEVLAALLDTYAALLPAHDVVLFSDYGKGGLAHVAAMIAAARQAGKPVLIDPKGADWSRYRHASVITPNRAELQQVVGHWLDEADLARRVSALRAELGLGALLLTRSDEGMSLFDADGAAHVAARAREVFDVTGAGDTVIATLAAMVAAGQPLRAAMTVANLAGGIVVGRFGTASVTRDELLAAAGG